MAGTSIVPYQDNNAEHDHTYYGNGCTGEAGDSASSKSCTSHIVQTKDGETQSIGTYYGFQASTSGAGATATDDNINISDTFCPLGWQLPYDGTGGDYYDKSKSWKYLIETAYDIETNVLNDSAVAKVASYPLSYAQSGMLNLGIARIYLLDDSGFYWSKTNNTSTAGYRLNLTLHNVRLSVSNIKVGLATVRCVTRY